MGYSRFNLHPRMLQLSRTCEGIASLLVITPLRVIVYYAEKLEIQDGPSPPVRTLVPRLANYFAAEHRIPDHKFNRLSLYEIGAMLRSDFERRSGTGTGTHQFLAVGRISLDLASRLLFWEGKQVPINQHADFAAFERLADSFGQLVTYKELLRAIKPEDVTEHPMRDAPPEVVEAVKHIRRAIKQRGCSVVVQNARHRGYTLRHAR